MVLYAGSLVPEAVIAHAPKDALVMDTAPMTLDELIAECRRSVEDAPNGHLLYGWRLRIWAHLRSEHEDGLERRLVLTYLVALSVADRWPAKAGPA